MSMIQRILVWLKKQRPYAAHWEWHDKAIKEQGLMNDFLEARTRTGLPTYKTVVAQKPDPPDFRAIEKSGKVIGIEITELVSEKAIQKNLKAKTPKQHVYCDWSNEDLISALQERIHEKGAKTYHGGPYDEIHLVMFTDEPVLTHRDVEKLLKMHPLKAPAQVSRAYLLFSYDPETKTYPLLEVKLVN